MQQSHKTDAELLGKHNSMNSGINEISKYIFTRPNK